MNTAAQRLADAVKKALGSGDFPRVNNPLDVQRFAINWILDEIDRLDAAVRTREDDGK